MRVSRLRPAVLMLCLGLAAVAVRAEADGPFIPTPRLNLPVEEVRPAFAPYAEFCAREAGACDLSGPQTLRLTPERLALIETVNRTVNRGIVLMADVQQYGVEEFWAYPRSGYGDCEDLALEKRARLVALGFPRGALRLGLAQDRRCLFTHALLLVETDAGTYVLDGLRSGVVLWFETPYNLEARERPDGRWERFDQRHWRYD